MFEIYSNDTGKGLYIANSRFGLNQAMDALEAQGISASYVPVTDQTPEYLATIPRWAEQ